MRVPTVAEQIAALPFRRGRPLLAVDCDEVLVFFAAHFEAFIGRLGFRLELETHRIDGAVVEAATGARAGSAQTGMLIERFFAEETRTQEPVPGAAAALAGLSRVADIVVLTNVPAFARADRVAKLAALGMPYPVVANTGGKGRALANLARRAAGPVGFVDDSPVQIESAARHAPGVARVHFVGCPRVRAVTPAPAAPHAAAADWGAVAALLSAHWG